MTHQENDDLPKDLKFTYHVCYGGPYDGTQAPSTNYAPAQPVIVFTATESGFAVIGTPDNLHRVDVDDALGCIDGEHEIYVLLKKFDHATGETREFYAYAGRDLDHYMDHVVVGAPSFEEDEDGPR